MKKILIISAAALVAMCACTKNDVTVAPDEEITFSVGTYCGQTKAEETEEQNPADYATKYGNVPFGTYSWFYQGNQTAQEFMIDETVSLNSGAWKPSKTYYWPKTGSIDFISYSPKSISEYVTVTPNSIGIGEDYTVEHLTGVDVMYADKAIEQTKNINTYYYSGVPTLFRHALAKINVNLKTAYDKKVVVEGDDETEWNITVKDIIISNLYNTGSVELGLKQDGKSWNLPEGSVWDNNGKTIDQSFKANLPEDSSISEDEPAKSFIKDYFVLPQNLTPIEKEGDVTQTITIVVDIVTTLPNGQTIKETGVELTAPMSTEALTAWQMNKNVTYNLTIVPAAQYGPDPDPIAILFDPAVVDWEDSDPASVDIEK